MDIEKGTFTPLIFGATGGLARECSIFLSKFTERLADKRKSRKGDIIAGIRRKIAFVLIRSVVSCLRGERASPSFMKSQLT